MPKYVHIEGLDCSGKSCVARSFAAMQPSEWELREGTIGGDNPVLRHADEMCESGQHPDDVVGLRYADALRYDLENYVPPEIHTVQVSTTLLRSLAYHAIKGNVQVLRAFEDLAPMHPNFDRSFMLTTSPEVCMGRLALRGNNSAHDLAIVSDRQRYLRMQDQLKEYAQGIFGTEVIDTTNLTVDEVAAYISQQVNKEEK